MTRFPCLQPEKKYDIVVINNNNKNALKLQDWSWC